MIILDSNIWIAYFSKKDSQHKKAVELFMGLTERVILPEYLIIEICSVLALRAGKKAADGFLEFISNNNDLEIILSDKEIFLASMGVFQKIKTKKLSFVDCSLIYLSDFYKIFTFDKSLEKEIKRLK